jgi:hypothetical protein
LVFLALAVAWLSLVLRVTPNLESHLLALASLAILTLLPVYHRFYDTRLLLLTVPAVVLIFKKHRVFGSIISGVTVFAIVSVQFRLQGYWLQQGKLQTILTNKWLLIPLLRQQNLELLLLFCLYLVALRSLRLAQTQLGPGYPSALQPR